MPDLAMSLGNVTTLLELRDCVRSCLTFAREGIMPRAAWNRVVAYSLVSFAALLSAIPSDAVPIDYTEAVSGDLGLPGTPFLLDAGSNTISGNTHFAFNSPGGPRFDTDADSFAFIIPTGLRLVSMSLSFAATSSNVSGADLELRLCSVVGTCGVDAAELLGTDGIDFLAASPQTVEFGLQFPLAAGSYSLFTSGIGIGVANVSIPQAAWSADYSWVLAVQSIPEPEVLSLLALGLTAMLALRARPQWLG